MVTASQENTLIRDFGVCSIQILSTNPPVQYTLHATQSTTYRFAVVTNDSQVDAQVTFTPFHRSSCSFTYHEYKVQRLNGKLDEESQSVVIAIAQQLYDKHFLQNAGYHFKFLEQDLLNARKRKSNQQSRVTKVAETDQWVTQEYCPAIYKSENSTKRPKRASDKVSIEAIQATYKDAYKQDKLRSLFVPELQQSSNARWDPYQIPAQRLSEALLDENKLTKLQSNLVVLTQNVPSAAEWTVEAQARELTPADVRRLLQAAFGATSDPPRLVYDQDTSPIVAIGVRLLAYADYLDGQTRTFRRAVLLIRLIGFSVMRVYEETAPNAQVDDEMRRWYPGEPTWQKKSRNLACYWNWMTARLLGWKGRDMALYLLLTAEEGGESTLRNYFRRSVPATAGELLTILNSPHYAIEYTDAMGMPSVIEIVRCLLNRHVADIDICRALGCPDTYLEGSAIDWFDKLQIGENRLKSMLIPINFSENINMYSKDILQDSNDRFAFHLDMAETFPLDV